MTTNNSEKTLIVFDTNRLQTTLDGEHDYSLFDPKGDIKRLKDFISKNNLSDKILIGFSDVVLQEYCNHRKKDFASKLDQCKKLCSKMKNLEDCDFDNIKFPEDSFDYGSYLSNKIKETISNPENSFILIPLDEEKHSEVFKKILDRAINHKKPFDERGDKGFKDSIIFESLVEFQIKNNFAKVILFTGNLKDFPEELREEFSKLTEKLLDVEANYDLLEQSLEGIYRILIKYPKLLEYLKSDYFAAKLEDYANDFWELGINNFAITNYCAGIEDCTSQDLKDFELEDYLEEIMDNFKKVSLEFENDGKKYKCNLIFDLSINEIIGGTYEEKPTEQFI